jgi:SAM-dependent methyltransferase
MTIETARFTGNIPHHYETGLGPVLFADFANDISKRIAAENPARVLEIAAGTGIVTRALRSLLPAGAQLTASDLNPPMLDVARTKFEPGEDIEFQTVDAMALPFEDGSFDAVLCQFGLMFFPDKKLSFREVFRVLAPSGHYVFSVWDQHRYNPFARFTHELVKLCFPEDPPQFYAVPFSCHQIDPIKEAVLEAGFSDITIAVLKLDKNVPDLSVFARGLIFGNPLIDQINARGGVDPEKMVEELIADLGREFGTNPTRVALQTMLYSVRKPS